MKVALVYDRVNKWGGAERVLLTLHEMFPDAPLYTSVYSPKNAPWAKVFPAVTPSFLQKIPFASTSHEYLAPLMPIAFESFNFDGYDLVISVTSEAAKGILTKQHTKHICYCLTPTRYLWSGYDFYLSYRSLERILAQPVVGYLRTWDKIAAQRPDVMVAISTAVKDRIKKYYGRDSAVIYPPATPALAWRAGPPVENGKYFLVVSRLVPYKRVALAIEAFNRLKLPLVVVGTGSEEGRLKEMAKPNIKFVGQLTEDKLHDYYKRCTALIMPQEEDFGLVALEAQAAGKPVIAYKGGGAKDSILEGKTGILFNQQTIKSLIEAIERFEKMKFDSKDCVENAERFSSARFKKEFLKLI
ncbi:glycosyltransferase [Candidatus Woesebacteria bacterium]|nr:glycosyltransferase [Candidatus Woesebacteria bacterium]